MLGLRDFVVVAPASSSFHQQTEPIFSGHHHHHHQHHTASAASPTTLGIGVGVFPLLAAPTGGGGGGDVNARAAQLGMIGVGGGSDPNVGSNCFSGGGGGDFACGGAAAAVMVACRDCGNKAKKDCKYRRCRTCCKTRGYDCATHVKSTWVPAARRRERQMMMAAAGISGGGGSSGSSSGEAKRPRLFVHHPTASHNSVSTKSLDATSIHQDAEFKEILPGQVHAPAIFRCVRVTALEDGDGELAYRAIVTIGGHVFKGFLYDQGIDEKNRDPCTSELQLEASSNCERIRDSSSSPNQNQSNAYASPTACEPVGDTT